ncbi:MAG: hypothetical protein QOE46_1110 [Acidobacteriota bacterium]|nr:hypothetical protein [Acidobacteriota bacterium]
MLSGRRKLLLADDSPTIRKVISLTFGDEGVEVVAVGDGTEALRALEDEPPPDIILADVVMPGPDGYELCERIKRDRRLKHVPVVLLVGTFEPFNEAEARRVGADTVLTKPFQSIRDLVSKVGSLLGGESKHEEEAAAAVAAGAASAPREESARPVEHVEEMHAPSADAATKPAQAAHDNAALDSQSDAPHAEEPLLSFADLGDDDELIEARPADAFGAAASSLASPPERAFAETHEPDLLMEPSFEANGKASPAPADRDAEWTAQGKERETTRTAEESVLDETEESVMHEETSSQPSFNANAADDAADDALLDLGRMDAPVNVSAAEADDFVLDLDFEDELMLPAAPDSGASESPSYEVQASAPAAAWADAPSAFAEAAHGEQPRSFMESSPAYTEAAHADAATSFSAEGHDAPWRDVVMQDGPQGFAFDNTPQQVVAAPRSFVEPEVVPADEPVPAVVESEFTDGSVEGDVPRAPAAHATSPLVGQARAGIDEEPVRAADQLSREAIDAIARRVVEMMSDKVVREIAWEVVPELAELLIKQRLDEQGRK